MLTALGWGALAAASLVIGALLALARRWRDGVVGAVLAFGAGALISSVAFELAQEGLQVGSPLSVALGLALGALTFFFANRAVENIGGRQGGGAAGLPLALGSLLDGVPEQAVLGIGLAGQFGWHWARGRRSRHHHDPAHAPVHADDPQPQLQIKTDRKILN